MQKSWSIYFFAYSSQKTYCIPVPRTRSASTSWSASCNTRIATSWMSSAPAVTRSRPSSVTRRRWCSASAAALFYANPRGEGPGSQKVINHLGQFSILSPVQWLSTWVFIGQLNENFWRKIWQCNSKQVAPKRNSKASEVDNCRMKKCLPKKHRWERSCVSSGRQWEVDKP